MLLIENREAAPLLFNDPSVPVSSLGSPQRVVLVVRADNIVPLLHLDDVSHDDALLWRGGGEAGGKKKTETC